ncbi:GntR family transcriptional regulator [Clostridium tyrobutyricum]|jgi:DNA-binding transcriptional regulator YhcF (GntR family)|uniref:Transcriptional regulator, GntR family n=1 Tax=Clostridium tyrobutyricum DIVETGP TaxID=1408889 RepID=W6NAT2_CLOTY|nr:GntR family transcriptional regulator [Clostridium tyrobutyricum]AND84595.1 GntR family transcriptional regulator [Clostridium tyrobutyricum]ANP69201.1 GntR family transcriptional regulator [Clostridium tyrobutyricum]MBV4425053.1 GntR family transcriptional regulator [Clostridium tyrobutyricum]MBV4427322.1 GntR family transcriptional regulator [Clostridium tyrobutyricum]MBV4433408.1 GntR family transcriptional regulator [Clostridium tyrobutyricum]
MSVEFDPNVPIYKQIMNIVKRKIISNEIKPGDKLPSIREMSSNLKVNPNTIQRTYQELERSGITYTQRGMGNFVKEDIDMVGRLKHEMAEKVIDNFIDGMKDLGFSGSQILNIVEKRIVDVTSEGREER